MHRFTHAWEKTASLALRHGHPHVIDTYLDHQRITDGDHDTMTDAAYTAWQADRAQGLVSLLIAETREDVSALNTRARADLILDSTLTPSREVALHDGTTAGIGDTIITCLNNRRFRTASGRDWVRNGDIWTIAGVGDDGTLTIHKPGRRFGDSILLPAAYVVEHVDLGYAVTAYRAQGTTTDTAHVLVEPTSARETFYVATHGRHSNHAYVTLDRADDHTQPHPGDNPNATARSVLYGVLQHSGAELSAHKTIAAAAQHDRWATLLRTSGLTTDEADRAIGSDAFSPLTAELRRAEANHHDPDALLPRLVAPHAGSATPTTSPRSSITASNEPPNV